MVLVAIGIMVYFIRKKQKEKARMVQWGNPPAASGGSSSLDCWACGWTERRNRRVKRPKKPIIKSDIRVNTLTVREMPPGFIDVKSVECELESSDAETENLYEVPVGPRSNYPDIKTTVL